MLVYPFLDPRRAFASYAATDGGLTADEAAWYWQQYAGAPDDLDDPDLAPLRSDRLDDPAADAGGQAAEHDVLADEDERARRAASREAGVDVERHDVPRA